MGDGSPEVAQAGTRVFEDAAFAQEILEGKHDYPEIRQAILEDLAEAQNTPVADFVRTANPARNPQVLLDYIEHGPKPGGMRVQHIIDRAASW